VTAAAFRKLVRGPTGPFIVIQLDLDDLFIPSSIWLRSTRYSSVRGLPPPGGKGAFRNHASTAAGRPPLQNQRSSAETST
jgi:hypothetical protein